MSFSSNVNRVVSERGMILHMSIKHFEVLRRGKELNVSFLIDTSSFGSPSNFGIFRRSSVDHRLGVDGQESSTVHQDEVVSDEITLFGHWRIIPRKHVYFTFDELDKDLLDIFGFFRFSPRLNSVQFLQFKGKGNKLPWQCKAKKDDSWSSHQRQAIENLPIVHLGTHPKWQCDECMTWDGFSKRQVSHLLCHEWEPLSLEEDKEFTHRIPRKRSTEFRFDETQTSQDLMSGLFQVESIKVKSRNSRVQQSFAHSNSQLDSKGFNFFIIRLIVSCDKKVLEQVQVRPRSLGGQKSC